MINRFLLQSFTRFRILLFLFWLLLSTGVVQQQAGAGQPGVLRNPLNVNGGADPWLTYYEGNYYLATTTWASEWTMRMSPTLAGLKTATPVQIYYETDPSRCCNMWAPEFRLLDGPNGLRWYFYYTAGTAGTYDNQHSHVLESEGTDPMGPYTYKGQLFDPENNTWSIDGSVMELNGSLYFLFSAFQNGLQSLFIAEMENPWTLRPGRVLISEPEYPWERQGGNVNEGPVALYHEDDTFIVYSASSCNTPDYKLGMLAYIGGEPMSRDSWVKHPEPVFQRADEINVFAPGHNGFFQSPDGTEDWIVYHANDSVNGGCDGRRTTRVQRVNWNEDGTPNFGTPVSTEEEIAAPSGDTGVDPIPQFEPVAISRFSVYELEDAYLRHANFSLRTAFNPNPVADSQFTIVPGLADPEAVSIESINFPGFFWRHQNNFVLLSPNDYSDTFAEEATWWMRPGLADPEAISFEAYSQPNRYIGRLLGITALVEQTDSMADRARAEATFVEERGS